MFVALCCMFVHIAITLQLSCTLSDYYVIVFIFIHRRHLHILTLVYFCISITNKLLSS